MGLSLGFRKLYASNHGSDFLSSLIFLSVSCRIGHHVFQLHHRVGLVIVIVEACDLFVLHLACDECLALLSTIEQVQELLLEELLEILVVFCYLEQVVESIEGDYVFGLGLRIQELIVQTVCISHCFCCDLDRRVDKRSFFIEVSEV